MLPAYSAAKKAMYQRLANDAAFLALEASVGTTLLTNQPLPYVQIGEATQNDWPTFTSTGKDITLTLHIWSESPSDDEADGILAVIDSLLDKQPLTTDGWQVVSIVNENTNALRDPGDITRHVIARYRLRMEQA